MKTLYRILIAALATVPLGAHAQSPDAQDIVNRASAAAYYQGRDGKAKIHMSIVDSQDRERTRDFVILRRDKGDVDNGEQTFYLLFKRPADVNKTAFMVWKHTDQDDDRWLYLPALDLVKRIAASDERTSFVGSHFFYEDVSGRGPTEDNHELVEDSETYYTVKSVPKDPDAVEFAHYVSWIHKTTMIPVKSEYYDSTGKVYRTYSALKVETVSEYPTVIQSSMEDHRLGGKTVMGYSSVQYNIDVPEDIFTERYLRAPPRKHLR